jgi:hypothetical protein
MLTSEKGLTEGSKTVVVLYRHQDDEGKWVWTARKDVDQASLPKETGKSAEAAVGGLLKKLNLSRDDIDLREIEDVSAYQKVMLLRRDKPTPQMEGYYVRDPDNRLDSIEIGRIGEAATLPLDEAYQVKEENPSFNFDFKVGEKRKKTH